MGAIIGIAVGIVLIALGVAVAVASLKGPLAPLVSPLEALTGFALAIAVRRVAAVLASPVVLDRLVGLLFAVRLDGPVGQGYRPAIVAALNGRAIACGDVEMCRRGLLGRVAIGACQFQLLGPAVAGSVLAAGRAGPAGTRPTRLLGWWLGCWRGIFLYAGDLEYV